MNSKAHTVKLITTVTVLSLAGAITFFRQSVSGQNTQKSEITIAKAFPPLGNTLPIAKDVELSATLVKPGKAEYEPLSPVTVRLVMKNNSKNPISFMDRASSGDYDIRVKDVYGNLMPATRFGHKYDPSEFYFATLSRTIWLKSGETRDFQLDINRMMDMTVEGAYSILVLRPILVDKQYVEARSNELDVRIRIPESDRYPKILPGGVAVYGP